MPTLMEIDAADCERLLRSAHIGRFALVTPRGPEVLPVNYAVREHAVVARTDPGGMLVRHGRDAVVVFQVDAVDEVYGTGWSVMVHGRGEVDLDPPGPDATEPGGVPRPWVDGPRTCEFRLPWTELTGRRIGQGAPS